MRSRQPKQLLLAFFGEHVVDDDPGPIRASVLIGVLEGAGVAAPRRGPPDRLVQTDPARRKERARDLFSLTEHAGGPAGGDGPASGARARSTPRARMDARHG